MITGKGSIVDGLINGASCVWCGNSEIGCGPQIQVFKTLGISLIVLILVLAVVDLLDNKLKKL